MLVRRNRGSWRLVLLGSVRGAEGPSAEGPDSERGRDALVYELLMLRQLEQNAMVWQTPALSLAAEAFLLTIALGGESSRFARLLSSALSVVVAVLAMQLMAKHRFLAHTDEEYMQQLEGPLGLPGIAKREWEGPANSLFTRLSSYRVWQVGLGLFGLAGALIFFVALLDLVDLSSASPTPEPAPPTPPGPAG